MTRGHEKSWPRVGVACSGLSYQSLGGCQVFLRILAGTGLRRVRRLSSGSAWRPSARCEDTHVYDDVVADATSLAEGPEFPKRFLTWI